MWGRNVPPMPGIPPGATEDVSIEAPEKDEYKAECKEGSFI
jgi:hypothetical protein